METMPTRSEDGEKCDWDQIANTYKERMCSLYQRIDENFGVKEKYEAAQQYASDHPLIAMATLVTIAMCAVPITCFASFVVGSVIFSMIGFLFFEGMLLTFGGMVLGFFLCIAGVASLFISGFLAMSYLSFHLGNSMVAGAIQRYRDYTDNSSQAPPPPAAAVAPEKEESKPYYPSQSHADDSDE